MIKNKNLRRKLAAGALTAGVMTLATLRAGAAPIALQNQSFESTSGNKPTVWTGVSQYIGVTSQYLSTSVGTGASGSDFLELLPQYGAAGATANSSQSTMEDITALDAGDTITLNVALGEFDYFGTTFGVTSADYDNTVELKIGGTIISNETSPTLTPGGFSELTLSYVVKPTDSGVVSVEFITPAYISSLSNVAVDRYYDNVSLDLSAPAATVPEPSTWAMLLGGLCLLMLRLRKRLLP